ncbi:hypothetical protein AMJ80_00010 [bacterium SM23_31]|nr:MAG: hypothetical protein AMJ80_00010 [bacterium SM23_31]
MNKREFLKILGAGAVGLAANSLIFKSCFLIRKDGQEKHKNWAWITTDLKTPVDEWKRKFAGMHEAGIHAILPEIYGSRRAHYASKHLPVDENWLEMILPAAKAEGLEIHAWMWCMPCNIEDIQKKHPEWFSVNGKGESSLDKPAYVDYCKFLCPSRPEVHEFIQMTAAELAQYETLDGIHLDYIRYPDVILAEALQPKYGIVQDREYPEYDYCYCEVCRNKFKEKTGIDPLKLQEPSENKEWRQFRYDSITNIVNDKLIPIAHKYNKVISAAVFPNWEFVRQEWYRWNLDAVMPMLYHSFYNEDMEWIKKQTEKGVMSLPKNIPLYSGLYVPQLRPDELTEAVEASFDGGAKGIVLFSANAMTDAHWKYFSKAVKS